MYISDDIKYNVIDMHKFGNVNEAQLLEIEVEGGE